MSKAASKSLSESAPHEPADAQDLVRETGSNGTLLDPCEQGTVSGSDLTAKAADEAAAKALAQMQQKAAESAKVTACRQALEPLANLNLLDPSADPDKKSIPKIYRICRCGVESTITNADIERARNAMTNDLSLAEIRLALLPLAKLPLDYQVTEIDRVLYQFVGRDGKPCAITSRHIQLARQLSQE